MVVEDIDLEKVPRHIGCVMDGNGRWARQRGLPRTAGHAAGEEAMLDAIDGALEIGVGWLSMYAFSTENWRRPADEVRFLMQFNEGILIRNRNDLHAKGVRIRFAGRRDWRVPRRLLKNMDDAVEMTRRNRTITLTICFNYGGAPRSSTPCAAWSKTASARRRWTSGRSAPGCTTRTCPTRTS